MIISAYQPVEKRGKEGNTSVASQHRSLLLQSNDPTDNPRTAFQRDLKEQLHEYIRDGIECLLVGDFNEEFRSESDGIGSLATHLGLINLMVHRHPDKTPPVTYARGRKCLDFALGTPRIAQAVIAAGYEAFNERFVSDHRGYFLDMDTAILFGSPTQDLAPLSRRQLRTTNIHHNTMYIERLHEMLSNHRVFERAQKLTLAGDRHKLAEALDRDITAACLAAEAKLPAVGEAAWSIELASARKRVHILGKVISTVKANRDPSTVYAEAREIMPPTWEPPFSSQELSQQWRAAKKEASTIAAESVTHREKEIRARITHLEQSSNPSDKTSATIIRRIKRAEDLKHLWRKLKGVRQSSQPRGVVRLEIPSHPDIDPKKCDDWQIIDVPTEIVRHLKDRNHLHFGQAHGTPFTIPPLSEDLGFSGDGPGTASILNGTYDTTTFSKPVQILLNHLKYVHNTDSEFCRPTISDAEFCAKLKTWRESTSTSPSGMHLGHYKVLVARHSFSTTASDTDLTPAFIARRNDINRKQEEIRSTKLALINYALERGYSFKRWQNIVNSVLFKDPDNMRLHRTRIIHIYEADFNLAMGLKWRVATQQAEDLKTLNEGQYGSRTTRSAVEPVYIEELQCEISRATRKPLVLTNYDATSCYDRIIPSLGMLVSQKYGVPSSVTKATAETLRLATYKVRTELGIAEVGYSHSDESPVYGTGQGSTFSGQTWTFQSSTLIDCYDKDAIPAEYSSPSGDESVKLGIAGFVDDCNGQTNSFQEDGSSATVAKILHHAQHNAQTWTDLLSASGGALEVSKCSCHVLQFRFTAQGAPFLVPSLPDDSTTISVWDPNDKANHNILIMNAYQAHKTLGHYKEPAGAQKEQFRQLLTKSEEKTAFLWSCPLTRAEAWMFYYACYLTSVGYPLACSSMTTNQLNTIQRKAMSIIIPRCGFNRNTKKEILYGPLEYGGASFRPLWVQQGIGQVTLFLRHWRKNTQSGKLSRIALAWMQVQAGVSFQLLARPAAPVPQLESKWFQSMRTFLATIEASIEINDFKPPSLQRLHDCVIMDAVQSHGEFTDAEIRRINYCRLFLQAETISDLTTVSGKMLDSSKLKGTWSLQSSYYHGNFIYQERPNEATWALWRRANKIWSQPTGDLHQPLGDWVIDSIRDHRQRQFCYWAWNYLWIRVDNGYVKCDPIQAREFQESEEIYSWEEIPTEATPMEAEIIQPGFWKCTTATYTLVQGITPATTFEEFVRTLPTWEQELLQHTTLASDAYSIGVALEHGLRAVSDGSTWFQTQGSFGWILSSDTGERLAIGMGPARGPKPNSFRSEGYGMLALLSFLKRIAEFINLHDPWEGILATDSKSLIDTVRIPTPSNQSHVHGSTYKRPLDPLTPEWDVVIGVQSLLREMPGLQLQHIKGHQDERREFHRLPLLAQLNVEADALANKYQRDHGGFQPHVLFTTWAGVHLILPSGTVTSKYESALRFQASAQPLKEYIRIRNNWSVQTCDTVNWTAHGKSLRSHLPRKTHLVKLVHGILPINSKIHRHDQVRSLCPCCKRQRETWQHILQCPAPSRSEWRKNMLNAMDKKCESLRTQPELRHLLITALTEWTSWVTEDTTYRYIPELSVNQPPTIKRVIFQQNAIGWHQLFFGRFSVAWGEVQDDYYATTINSKESKRRSGAQWQKAIIGELWSQWFILWEMRNGDQHGSTETTRQRIERE